MRKITISVTSSRYFNETAGVVHVYPSEEVETFQIRCLITKFVHALEVHACMLSHLCILQVTRILMHL